MLRELTVHNLALIEDVRVELCSGYCVWTGETGAGKSLLLTALELVLGGKSNTDLIRSGRTEACISAVFAISDRALRDAIAVIIAEPLDDDLIITRRIHAEGRSTAHVNDRPVNVRTLRTLGALLVDIHGQDDSGSILIADQQCLWLDAWSQLDSTRQDFQTCRQAHLLLVHTRQKLIDASQASERERALLEFELEELVALKPKVGDHDQLTALSLRLGQADRIRTVTSQTFQSIYEADHSAQGLLMTAARQLETLGNVAPEVVEAARELARLANETREVAYTLRQVAHESLDVGKKLDLIETRLAHYRKLVTRFHCEPDGLAERLLATKNRLDAITRDESDLKALDVPMAAAWVDVLAAADRLSALRNQGAITLTRAVQARMKGLGLAQARIELRVEKIVLDPHCPKPSIPLLGSDRVEWMFTPNPGEPARPLRDIASGGERSRVTLAIKAALAGRRSIPTLVFDEIDAGVGGRLGSALGKSLKELSQHHQVLCITHLPQLASHADHHWVIRKRITSGLTKTTIQPLGQSDRVGEVAAMIRGDSASETTRREAEAMIAEASPAKAPPTRRLRPTTR